MRTCWVFAHTVTFSHVSRNIDVLTLGVMSEIVGMSDYEIFIRQIILLQ